MERETEHWIKHSWLIWVSLEEEREREECAERVNRRWRCGEWWGSLLFQLCGKECCSDVTAAGGSMPTDDTIPRPPRSALQQPKSSLDPLNLLAAFSSLTFQFNHQHHSIVFVLMCFYGGGFCRTATKAEKNERKWKEQEETRQMGKNNSMVTNTLYTHTDFVSIEAEKSSFYSVKITFIKSKWCYGRDKKRSRRRQHNRAVSPEG